MPDELRQLRKMLFGRKSERFMSRFKLDFEGISQLEEEWEYAALQEAAPVSRKEEAPRIKRPTEERQRHIFPEHRNKSFELCEVQARRRRDYRTVGIQVRRALCPPFDMS